MRPDPSPSESVGGRLRGDGGSLIVELALVTPLLVTLLLGIFEFGMAYRERTSLAQAVRSAARVETSEGLARDSEWLGLTAMRSILLQSKRLTVQKVVVYRTTAANGDPLDSSCFNAGSAAFQCNFYTAAQYNALGNTYLANFGPNATTCGATAWDANWCPLNRNNLQSDPPDYVGVWVQASYQSYTGLLTSTVTFTDRAVFRIDPDPTSS
jgi:Flp pilus assembly protein TadG